jgi:hypothetical protein
MSRALSGTALRRRSASCAGRTISAVDPEPLLVGIQLDAAEAAGVPHPEVAAAGEAQDQAVPRLLLPPARVQELVDAGAAVDQQTAGHPEAQAEHRAVAVGVEQEQLADAAGGGEPPPDERRPQRGSGQPPLQVPGIGGDHLDDRSPERPLLRQPPVGLDLRQLRHVRLARAGAR